jgi:hypothetical protein
LGAAPTAQTVASDREIVLFPFDDYSLPFNKGLVLTLLPGAKSKPVLTPGGPGDPDERRIYFSGTVLEIDGEYHMWYSGFSREGLRQVCYAVSKDGSKWERPDLGLVEFNGDKQNNLTAINGYEPMEGMICLVLYEPEDPKPDRRFKMVRELSPENSVKVAFSADGLRWISGANDEFVVKTEPSGLINRDGVYYLNGHGRPAPHPIPVRGHMRPQKRMMVTHISYDFEHWTEAGHVSFRRDHLPPRPQLDYEFHRGEQVHLGAAMWDRGNVVLGFYGKYFNPTDDRRTSTCDLGLIISPDGLHFKEPLPDFKIVPSFEELDRAEPRLTQGQAFHNIGEQTVHYYGIWTELNRDGPTGVRTATWARDRLGYFSPILNAKGAHCISDVLTPGPGARVYVNVTGLSEHSELTVEILDEQLRPFPGYTAKECVLGAEQSSGLRVPVTWGDHHSLSTSDQPIRVRINFGGVRPEDLRLYAAYVE